MIGLSHDVCWWQEREVILRLLIIRDQSTGIWLDLTENAFSLYFAFVDNIFLRGKFKPSDPYW
jgi:hypothetical protein